MFWQEETSADQYRISDEVVDLVFSIQCRELPVDHAHSLSCAIFAAAPWMQDAPLVGIHSIHVAGSQNGWERPEHGSDQHIMLSHRTKLSIRLPSAQKERLQQDLLGRELLIDGCPLSIRQAKLKPLSKQTTLFARYVENQQDEDENAFLQWAMAELRKQDIRVRKALCGKPAALSTPQGPLATRSLMLADLTVEEAVHLQQRGLGGQRHLGCGIFIPHKGIDAVKKLEEG